MDRKYKRLIEVLLYSEKTMTAKELSLIMNVSTKTIRNYVSMINSEKDCIFSTNKGYKIDNNKAKEILSEEEVISLPENQKERVLYILKQLLLNSDKAAIDLNDLSDDLIVSIDTIKKDFVIVKEKLIKNNLFVQINHDCVVVEGLEKDKRRLLSKLLSEELNENLLNLNVLDYIFPDLDIKNLAKKIQQICHENSYFINDYALVNLILELAIEISRKKTNVKKIPMKVHIGNLTQKEMHLVNKLVSELEEKYEIIYEKNEYEELARIFLSSLVNLDYSKIPYEKIDEILDRKSLELIDLLKKQLKDWILFNVENEEFLVKFAFHIKNLLTRLDNEYEIKNPLTKHIKMSSPLIFEYAVEIGDIISKFTKKVISEDEITFLALHIGSILVEDNYFNYRIKSALFFPKYYDYTFNLINEINKQFKNDLVINQIVSNIEEIDEKDNDIIITTISSVNIIGLKSVQITPFLTKNDKNTITTAIEKIKLTKKRDYLREQLLNITDSDLFCKNRIFKDKIDVIKYICTQMMKKQYINKEYLQDILEREEQSSTAFGKLAVPHSIKMEANKTVMFILLLEKPLKWDENEVNIVLLFTIKKDERSLFFNIFDSIVSQLLEPENIKKVLSSNSINEAIDNLVNCV